MESVDERTARYGEAIEAPWHDVLDTVIAVADAEQVDLRAEVKSLERRVRHLSDRVRHLSDTEIVLRSEVRNPFANGEAFEEQLMRAVAAEAKVKAVEALIEEWERGPARERFAAAEVRAAIGKKPTR